MTEKTPPKSPVSNTQILVLSGLIAAIAFSVDLLLPTTVSGEITYVAIVLFSLWTPKPAHTIFAAVVGTALTIAGLIFSTRWNEMTWHLLTNRTLCIGVIWTTALVVLQRKRSDEVSRDARRTVDQREREMSDLAENAPIALRFMTAGGRIEWANRAELELLGYSPGEYFGRHFSEFHIDAEEVASIQSHIDARKPLQNFEARLRGRDGSIRYVLISSNDFNRDGDLAYSRWFARDITARRQTEQQLRVTETRFRAIQAAADWIVWTAAPDGAFIEEQPSWSDYTGQRKEFYLDFGWTDMVHPDDRAPLLKTWEEAVQSEKPYQSEGRLWNSRRGEYRYFLVRAIPLLDGSIREWIGIVIDMEDHKRIERALSLSEERLRAALLGSDAGIFRWDLQSNGMEWDAALDRLLEAPEGSAPSIDLWVEAVDMDDRQPLRASLEKVVSEGADLSVEFRVRRPDGHVRWLSGRGKTSLSSAGVPATLTGSCVDITTQKLAEEELLRASQHMAERVIQAAPQLIYIFDLKEQRNLYVNRQIRKLLGYDEEQYRQFGAQLLEHIVVAEDLPVMHRFFERLAAAKDNEVVPAEYRLRRSDGLVRWFSDAAVVFTRDPDGAASQVLGVATDISEARLVAEERATAMRDLHALAQRLEQNNRELQEFAYVASHDLQEPLRKIVAFGDRLRSNYGAQLEDQGLDYLNRMQRASRRMQSLVQDLLALSRITTRGQAFHRVDLTQVVAEVLSDLEVTIEETQAEVEVVNLMTIDADPTQIRQLFQNLLSNALKFRVAERCPRIQVQGQTTSMVFPGSSQIVEACQITISDNGIGFDPKYAQRIFDVFQRLHARNEYDGTGIGLAICRRIVERHSGVISADSTPGEGARFTVVMPRHTRRVIDESI